jgi:hypothetical protein
MSLDAQQRALFAAVVDRMIPPADFPHVSQADAAARLEERLDAEQLARWLRGLANESVTVYSTGFLDMHEGTRDEVLDRVESENCRTDWQMNPAPFFGQMIDTLAEYLRETGAM